MRKKLQIQKNCFGSSFLKPIDKYLSPNQMINTKTPIDYYNQLDFHGFSL